MLHELRFVGHKTHCGWCSRDHILLFERDGHAVERTEQRSVLAETIRADGFDARLLKKRDDDSIQTRVDLFDAADVRFNDLLRGKTALSDAASELRRAQTGEGCVFLG